jgi:hypothetical protein
VPATTPAPGHLPGPPTKDACLADGGDPADAPRLAKDLSLAEDPWLTDDPGPPPAWLTEDPEPDDPDDIIAWLDSELAKAAPWLTADPGWDDPAPSGPGTPAPPSPRTPGQPGPSTPGAGTSQLSCRATPQPTRATPQPTRATPQPTRATPQQPRRGTPEPPCPGTPVEVFKAGRWDRSRGDGGGFAAGGMADHLPPGPVLAGLAGDRWAAGLDQLGDDELIGILRAARRLTSWAAAMELAAVVDLWRRRTTEEDAGDTGAALHADAEIAAALTLTRHAADQLLNLAAALHRLPATSQALAVGDIDLPRAKVIADEITGLTDEHAAAVEIAIIGTASSQTTGQLRPAARRAVQAADPTAATKRKEQALREARVERWAEPAGTAALAGRDLPPAAVLAADANLTALAKQLKSAGGAGTLDSLRAEIYLALLTGAPVGSLLPTSPGHSCPGDAPADTDGPANTGGSSGNGPDEERSARQDPPDFTGPSSDDPAIGLLTTAGSLADTSSGPLTRSVDPGALRVTGRINLTLPLTTWLGQSDSPGYAAGYGPLDATDTRTLANALAADTRTKWCLTFTGPDGRPLAHGCAHTGSRRRLSTAARDRPGGGSRDGPGTWALPTTWTFTITPLTSGDCDHACETPAYQPSATLRHLVNLRHTTCVFPGCRRPATQCDADHTIAYQTGGRTCLCNLAPLCRHHHQVKQSPGWTLEQTSPGTLAWTTPSGRHYTIDPTSYPE